MLIQPKSALLPAISERRREGSENRHRASCVGLNFNSSRVFVVAVNTTNGKGIYDLFTL